MSRFLRDFSRWALETLELTLRSRSVRAGVLFAINAALVRVGSERRFHDFGRRRLRRHGIEFAFSTWDGLLTLRRDYERGIQSTIARVAERSGGSGTFLVIGAHIGRHALMASQRFALTLAVEPTPASAAHLVETIRRNGLERRVKFVSAACGDVDGEFLPFQLQDSDSKNSVDREGSSALLVPTVTIDRLVAANHAPALRLILIDAERAEESVLRGARRTLEDQRPDLIVETLGQKQRRAVEALLEPLGYSGQPVDATNTLFQPAGQS